jgi:hypothetical protein
MRRGLALNEEASSRFRQTARASRTSSARVVVPAAVAGAGDVAAEEVAARPLRLPPPPRRRRQVPTFSSTRSRLQPIKKLLTSTAASVA